MRATHAKVPRQAVRSSAGDLVDTGRRLSEPVALRALVTITEPGHEATVARLRRARI